MQYDFAQASSLCMLWTLAFKSMRSNSSSVQLSSIQMHVLWYVQLNSTYLNYLIRVLWAISPPVQEMSTLRKPSTWDLAGSTCLRRRWRSSTSPSTRCRSAHLRHVTLTCVTMTRCRSADPRHVTSTSSSRTSSPSSWRHRRHGYADAAASGWLGPPVSCHSRQSWRWRSFSRKTQTNL